MEVEEHTFVPKHEVISEKDESELLKRYGVEKKQLPKILNTDPAIKKLKLPRGRIIKITRHSLTTGKEIYYRVVV